MSSGSSPALVLEVSRRGRWLPAGVVLASGLSMPWLASLSPWLITTIALLSIGLVWWLAGRLAARVTVLTWQSDRQWQLQDAQGGIRHATLSARSWWTPWLMCLKFRDESGHSSQIMVWRDELPAGLWHRWQVRLRLEGHAPFLAAESG